MLDFRENHKIGDFTAGFVLNMHGLLEYTDGKLQKHGPKWVGHWFRFLITFDYVVRLLYFFRQKFYNFIDFSKI